MEIGGYMELEHFHSLPYYNHLYEFNLGRTALVWLLQSLSCKTLFLPYLICSSVPAACKKAGFSLEYYTLDENLAPILPRELGEGEYLYLVNYYGQLTDEQILAFKSRYDRIIVDHTQAFFQKPLKKIPTLYSCRKFFGVSDGAYLSCDSTAPLPDEIDVSCHRMEHLLGRFEFSASEFYKVMLKNADAFHDEIPKRMSALTKNLLSAIDYEGVRKTREKNYRFLKEQLDNENIMNATTPKGPFAFPFYTKNGIAIRKELAKKQIYIPTNWSNVIEEMPRDSIEYDLAANILSLPCDQRYDKWEMEHLADAVLLAVEQLGD